MVQGLEREVFPLASHLLEGLNYLAELDCLISMTLTAKEQRWTRPTVTNGTEIVIQAGRHPLHELFTSSFVSNDTDIRGGDVHIITGPNFSGKSVYLKQACPSHSYHPDVVEHTQVSEGRRGESDSQPSQVLLSHSTPTGCIGRLLSSHRLLRASISG